MPGIPGPCRNSAVGNNTLPGSPDIRLEVIDRSTEEAIRRLCNAGLFQMNIRATRYLHTKGDQSKAALTDEERGRIESHRALSKRKLKIGRVLAAEGLLDEAVAAVREAVLGVARAHAVQARLPEPEKLEETIRPPVAACWGESLPFIQRFLGESAPEIGPIIRALESSLGSVPVAPLEI